MLQRARSLPNVGANSLNVVSRTFPHFSVHVDTYVNESQFGGGKTILGHNLNIPAYTYLYMQGECYFLRFLLHVVRGLCSFDDLNIVDHEACQQRPESSAGRRSTSQRGSDWGRRWAFTIGTGEPIRGHPHHVRAERPIPTVDCSLGEPLWTIDPTNGRVFC